MSVILNNSVCVSTSIMLNQTALMPTNHMIEKERKKAQSQTTTMMMYSLPVVDYFHCAILLYPQFAQNDVVYTAERVTPCVRLAVSGWEE